MTRFTILISRFGHHEPKVGPPYCRIFGIQDPILTSSPLEESIIRTSSFHHEASRGTTFDLSQLMLRDADTHTMLLPLESIFALVALIPSSSRKHTR